MPTPTNDQPIVAMENIPPEVLLEGMVKTAHKRGHHKIIIGAAPGVGKTYRMLQEAHGLKRLGIDVVIGYFEPHGRKETIALLEGLELIPRKPIPYKGMTLEETDVEAILQRHPQTVLIDELAHTNAKGSPHEKRWQDVEEILNAGISVVSTLNIQHIESLNDLVTRITGVQVNERIPDHILDQADEVVLVDISVEELQERLSNGKIYAQEKIEQALGNFFKKGNLVALRELALREVANSVEEQAEEDVIACPLEPTGVHERIMVCISTHPNSQRLIRRGYRIANRFCGELIVVYVRLKNKSLSSEEQKTLEKSKQLVDSLEGKYIELEGCRIVDVLVAEAKERKITQIVLGESLTRSGPFGFINAFSFMKAPLPYQIFQRVNKIDVHIMALERHE